MAETRDIRNRSFNEGTNVTAIARETGYAKKTVRTYILCNDWNNEFADESGPSKLELFKPLINSRLENDKHQRRLYQERRGFLITHLASKQHSQQKILTIRTKHSHTITY